MPNVCEKAISILVNGKKDDTFIGESWPSLIVQRMIGEKRRRWEKGRGGEEGSHQHSVKAMKSISYKEHSGIDVEHGNRPFAIGTLRN